MDVGLPTYAGTSLYNFAEREPFAFQIECRSGVQGSISYTFLTGRESHADSTWSWTGLVAAFILRFPFGPGVTFLNWALSPVLCLTGRL